MSEALQEGLEHLSQIPGFTDTFEIIYYGHWSSYEEHGWLAVLVQDGAHYIIEGGYSVMVEGEQEDEWILRPVSFLEAVEEMDLMEKAINDVMDEGRAELN